MSLYIDQMFRSMIWFLPLYGVWRLWWVRLPGSRQENSRQIAREIVMAVFILFMLGLLTLTFRNGLERLKSHTFLQAWHRLRNGLGVNFTPFHTIKIYLRHAFDADILRVNIVGNIVMFVPWGLGLPLLWKKYQSAWKVTILSFVLPLCIEVIQLFIGRTVDVDDVILNFTGGLLGGLLYLLLRKVCPGVQKLAE